MSKPIKAKVARILNSREIVISAGIEQGVAVDMYFDVMDPNGEDIKDPDTGTVLGSVQRPKVRVKVTQAHEKLAVAMTYKKQEVNVGGYGTGFMADFGLLSKTLMPPKYITKYETLKTTEKTWEDLDEEESFVKTGDPVVQVIQVVSGED